MAGERRLVFWLQLSFAGDFVLAALAIALLWSDEIAGSYLLLFVALRAVIGAIALFWLAPRAAREVGSGDRRVEDELGPRWRIDGGELPPQDGPEADTAPSR
ncbi:hypothetical protein [Naasia sp. SYSU D00948]|uniref:hypothetical protein n=1 Tax=Naasia sp. SYSU D00948 TaxID=2817379 RepID=UPI001B305FD4|nr:hypothetical protein [Naasia sp. SYSU D00948]